MSWGNLRGLSGPKWPDLHRWRAWPPESLEKGPVDRHMSGMMEKYQKSLLVLGGVALAASFVAAPACVFAGVQIEVACVFASSATDGPQMIDGAGEIVASGVRYHPVITPGDPPTTSST